jgi:hypothetical protein
MNMPQVIKKFVRALNVFSSSLSKHIYVNALFGQENLVMVNKWNIVGTKVGLRYKN